MTIALIINYFLYLLGSWGGCRVLLGSDSTTISLTHFLLTDSPPPSTVLQWTSLFTSLYTSVWASIWSVSQRWTAGSKGICMLNIIYFWHAAPQNGSTIYTSTSTAGGFFSFHAHSPLKCASFEERKAVSHYVLSVTLLNTMISKHLFKCLLAVWASHLWIAYSRLLHFLYFPLGFSYFLLVFVSSVLLWAVMIFSGFWTGILYPDIVRFIIISLHRYIS